MKSSLSSAPVGSEQNLRRLQEFSSSSSVLYSETKISTRYNLHSDIFEFSEFAEH